MGSKPRTTPDGASNSLFSEPIGSHRQGSKRPLRRASEPPLKKFPASPEKFAACQLYGAVARQEEVIIPAAPIDGGPLPW
jgi:hypothetical protein